MPFFRNFKRKAVGLAAGVTVAFSLHAKGANLPATNSAVQKKPIVAQQVQTNKVETNTNRVYVLGGKIISTNQVAFSKSTTNSLVSATNEFAMLKTKASKEVTSLSQLSYSEARAFIKKNPQIFSKRSHLLTVASQAHNKRILEPIVREYASKFGVDPDLFVKFVQHESRWDPYAVGVSGDSGMTQLSRYIWDSAYASKYNCNPFNIKDNLRSSAMFLGELQRTFKDKRLVLTAYNEGIPAIKSKLKRGFSVESIVNGNKNNYAQKILTEKI